MFKQTTIVVLLCLASISVSSAQGIKESPFIAFPKPYESGMMHYSVGAALTLLPRQIVEEEIRQLPMVTVALRYGLPENFSVTAQLSTVYITNVVSAGAQWSMQTGNAAFALADEFSYWFGVADMDGFDTKAMGLINRPSISAGIQIDDDKVTVRSELLVMISQHTYFGSASVGRVKPEIVGVVTSLCLEQEILKSTSMSFALRANYALPNYQLWLAFSVQDRWLMYPEIQLSFLF
ncbi:MAG: hypothetical protein WCT99_05690 [Bacteroidota bacterium]|jgi:hypothetical protein